MGASRTRSRWRLLRKGTASTATTGVAPPSTEALHARQPLSRTRSDQAGRPPVDGTSSKSSEPSRPGARPDDLAGMDEATHVSCMLSQTKTQIVGFMELQVGSLAVQVPIRAAEPTPAMPLASFEVEGESYAILIRGDSSSKAVERAMGDAAKEAVAHLSRKLLN
jgi:hypothetical protein